MATVEFSAARIFAGTSANDGFNSEPILQTTYTLVYDADNRLVKVTWGSNSATFKYDGQGNRIKASITVGGTTTTTAYVGNYYELSGSTATKYYYAGAQMVAQRKGSAMYTLFSDHLGSVTATEDSAGHIIFQGYYPWGGIRTGTSNALPTDNTFTDQKTIESIGLMFYNARYYDSSLSRWVQPDTVIPDIYNPLDLDRYSYTNNNPVNGNDPTGHSVNPPSCPNGYCNKTWLDFHDWNPVFQTAADVGGAVVCLFAGCKVDMAGKKINGPSTNEFNQMVANNAVAIGADIELPESELFSSSVDLNKGSELDTATTAPVHGNSLNSPKKTSLYELLDSDGDHLKFGITSEVNPESRYTKQFMENKSMFIIDQGTRREIYELENAIITANRRGPLQLNDH